MYQPVFSKIFASKLRQFGLDRKNDINKAVERVLANPTLTQYKRAYISPHQQEHPTDKTLTIFFEEVSGSTKIFFVWINDDQHPHNTHQNYGDDPCIKEFLKLKNANELEIYSEPYHEGEFIVKPRENAPLFLKFKKYGVAVYLNVLNDDYTSYSLAVGTDTTSEEDLYDHYIVFFEKIRKHFISLKKSFEFRIPENDDSFLTLVKNNLDHSQWKHECAQGEHVYSIQ